MQFEKKARKETIKKTHFLKLIKHKKELIYEKKFYIHVNQYILLNF